MYVMTCLSVVPGMYYEMHGDGESLVVILGLGTDVSEWDGIMRWLAEKYKVLAFDNRGAGRTDKPDIPYSIEKNHKIQDRCQLWRRNCVLSGKRSMRRGPVSVGGRTASSIVDQAFSIWYYHPIQDTGSYLWRMLACAESIGKEV